MWSPGCRCCSARRADAKAGPARRRPGPGRGPVRTGGRDAPRRSSRPGAGSRRRARRRRAAGLPAAHRRRRSRAFSVGSRCRSAVCAEVVGRLVTIHGQSEQVRLAPGPAARGARPVRRPDAPGDGSARTAACYAEHRDAVAELTRLRGEAQERAREIDLLRFGLDEIERVDPQPEEDVALAAEAQRLQSVDDLRLARARARCVGADRRRRRGRRRAVRVGRSPEGIEPARRRSGARDRWPRGSRRRLPGHRLAADLAGYLDHLEAEPGRLE